MNMSLEHIRNWGFKGGLIIIDQVIFSGSNFFTNILLARWLFPEAYGSYSLAFSVLMFFYQFHFSFILDPMSVLGPVNYSNQLKNYLAHQYKLHFMVTIPVGMLGFLIFWRGRVLISSHQNVLSDLAIMMGVLPFLLVSWVLRRIVYVLQLPALSALASGIYAAISLLLLFFLRETHHFTTFTVILSMALASFLGTSFLFPFLRRDTENEVIPLKIIISENWNFGKWLIASSIIVILAGQAQVLVAGAVLGVESAGVIRALQNFAQPMILLVTALGNLAIPALSADFGRADFHAVRSKLSVISVSTIFLAGIYLVMLFLFRKPLELLFYDGQYSAYADLIPVWGLIPLLLAINLAPASALQAYQRPYALLLVSIFWSLASVGSGLLFALWWGIWGVTVSAVFGYIVAVLVFMILYKYWVARAIMPSNSS